MNESNAGPCAVIIYGAAGDLTKRKLIPALCNLARGELLPKEFAVIGFARTELTTEQFREKARQEIAQFATSELDSELVDWIVERLYYVQGNFDDSGAFQTLRTTLADIDSRHGTGGNYLHYLATSPEFFSVVVRELDATGLIGEEQGRWRRVIIEKPFGKDLDSARELNVELGQALKERQIYRIDHYLGKETVQNILVFRFANGIFEPIWNRRYVDHVQVTVAETVGVEQRGGYYDTSGAVRDMVPNHILQLVSLTAMEAPISFEANAVRDEQVKVLRALAPMTQEEVLTRAVRGQYGAAEVNGKKLAAYRAEPRVPEESNTETFVAMKLAIDNWRWADVPFYIRTGKRLPSRVTEIAIQFRRAPFILFRKTPIDHLNPNELILHIQPAEGISLSFGAKVPGPLLRLGTVDMDFDYSDYFGGAAATGYERLLYDCMAGDPTLFQRADMVEAAWSVVKPVQDVWKALTPASFPNYASGTWGPKESEELLSRDGRKWRKIG
ncbi:MAG: glucose-6-phosphate dehydrogenase [Bryobacteraceae bacterium]